MVLFYIVAALQLGISHILCWRQDHAFTCCIDRFSDCCSDTVDRQKFHSVGLGVIDNDGSIDVLCVLPRRLY